MSKVGKASLLIGGLFILASGVTRLVLNMWHDSLYVSLGIAAVFIGIAIFKDHKTYLEFFTMRTTKHGMNMGALILLALVFLISINFIAVKNERKFDMTTEGLNSLSDQSVKAANAIDSEFNVILLEAKEQSDPNLEATKQQILGLVKMYKNVNQKISFVAYNARQRPDLAQKYEFKSGDFGIFAEYKGKQLRVEQPTEEEMTKAILKSTRTTKKTVYFTFGHGEPSIADTGAAGLSALRQDLETIYDVKELKLIDVKQIPEDAAAVAIFGPAQQLVEPELQLVRAYLRAGGRLLLAADPGRAHNLAQLTKTVGVEFKNNYILDPRMSIPGMGNVAALGLTFSQASDVTKNFPAGSMAVFELASAIGKAPDASEGIVLGDVVRTDGGPVATNELAERPVTSGKGPFTLAMTSQGKLPDGTADFAAFIVGDADFALNKLYRANVNRDLIMNAVSYLAKDNDLISIRPKAPRGTEIFISREKLLMIVFLFLLPLPILLFGTGGFIWWRRKTA